MIQKVKCKCNYIHIYVMIIDYLLFLGMFDDRSGDRCGVGTNKALTQSLSRGFDGLKILYDSSLRSIDLPADEFFRLWSKVASTE